MKSEGPWFATAWICNLHCSQGGNEGLELVPKLVQFTDAHFPDINSNSCGNLNNLKLYRFKCLRLGEI